jgi:hypothetical protein
MDISEIQESLQQLIGLHRQLLDACRHEREALVQADLKAIEERTVAKQAIVEAIRAAETERLKRVSKLAMQTKKPVRELSLPLLIAHLQQGSPQARRGAELLQGSLSALTLLIERITEANASNRALVERSLEHVEEMKRNVLGEAVPKSNTYTQQGQRQAVTGGARLFNKEA